MSRKKAVTYQDNVLKYQSMRDWIIRGFVLAIFVVHPLIIMPDTYYSIVDTKRIFFTVVLIAACLGLLGLTAVTETVVSGLANWPGWKIIWKHIRPYEYALLAYWVIMLISACFAQYPEPAFFGSNVNNEGFLMQTAYLLTVVIVGRLYKLRESDLLALCISAAVVAGYGILQYYGHDFLRLTPEDMGNLRGPALTMISTMSNRNILSTYLSLSFCLSAGLFAKSTAKFRWIYLPVSWILFYMLVLGNSESGYVGVLTALLFALPLFLREWKSVGKLFFVVGSSLMLLLLVDRSFTFLGWPFVYHSMLPFFVVLGAGLLTASVILWCVKLPEISFRKLAIIWYILLIILLISGAAALPMLAEKSENQTLHQAAEILDGNFDDSFGSNRFFVWRRAIELIKERPIIGHGPDQFFVQFLFRYGEEAAERNGVYYDKAHNEYIQFAVDDGLIGLGCMLAFYALILLQALKKSGQPMAVVLIFSLVSFLAQAFFNFSTPLAHPVVWCLWGVLGSLPETLPSQELQA